MKTCKKCGKEFPTRMTIDGKSRNLMGRNYCIECSPFGSRRAGKVEHCKMIGQSPIWRMPTEEFRDLVKTSNSLTEILKVFGMKAPGGNMKTLKRRLEFDKIDFSHIPIGNGANKGRKFPERSIPLEQVMTEHSTYNRGSLKKRLLKDGILKNECSECKLGTELNGKEIVLNLDHRNGVQDDNRQENLRLLCPNCKSQTSTFGSRNKKQKQYNCQKCGRQITKHSKHVMCLFCVNAKQRRTVRPDDAVLKQQIAELGYCGAARLYGVSDNAIRKWI